MAFQFERAPGIDLDVTNFAAKVFETPGQAPQTVLQDTQTWRIEVEWEEIGPACSAVHGNWFVHVYAEALGPGLEILVGSAQTAMACGQHAVIIFVPALTLTVAAGQNATPYKLVTTLTAADHAGHRYPMAGYVEGPVVQIYTTP